MKFLVFDTETTGLPRIKFICPGYLEQWPHIVQFSYVIYDNTSNTLEINDNIIKIPDNIDIPKESSDIHSITKIMTNKYGVELDEVFQKFFQQVQTADYIIGHNINFDINMIRVELLRKIYKSEHDGIIHNIEEIQLWKQYLNELQNKKNIICTMKTNTYFCNITAVSKYGKTYIKYPTLNQLHNKLFSTEPKMLHDSSVDILVTLRCYMKKIYDIDLLNTCKAFKLRTRKIYN
jgi:DNA polymerase III epsilon subunit-like protein